MAAEISSAPGRPAASWRRFNEAAANGRGNHTGTKPGRMRPSRFNEAAANGRGNLAHGVSAGDLRFASMRPRRMAAEIILNSDDSVSFVLLQ